ncbi:MAG TPA: Rieske 2Fe-2S domain-containing protein [Chloroflexota bacterium]
MDSERRSTGPFNGYYQRDIPAEDEELTHVGPGTPAGEYFRRFWLPVSLSSSLQDLPRAIRILGEDLVAFRDGRGRAGLLALHCSHRGTSLEWATVEREGIRCCYHGWLYRFDGRVLDTPGEPGDGPYKDRLHHGAYPTREFKGLLFAYLGPPEREPPFPIFDTFELEGYRADPVGQQDVSGIIPCNWLQLAENNMDPVHRVFLHGLEGGRAELDEHRPSLHANTSLDHYIGDGLDAWDRHVAAQRGEIQGHVIEYQETEIGMFYIDTRRIGREDLVWIRVADYILPSIDQVARAVTVAEEQNEIPFDPPRTTTWTIPVDDTHTTSFELLYTPAKMEGVHAGRWRFASPRTSLERTYEERQSQPGDFEGQTSQRPIAVHNLEHLGWSDTGVAMVRKLLREDIRAVQRGEDPKLMGPAQRGVIDTHGQTTIIRIPRASGTEADRALLREAGRKVWAERRSRSGSPV